MEAESRTRRRGPIRWLRAHPAQADFLLALFITGLAVTFHVLDFDSDDEFRSPSWWTVPLIVLAMFPVAWRRRFTAASAMVVVAAQIVVALADLQGTGFLGVVIALYSLGAHASGNARGRAVAATVGSIGVLFVVGLAESELDLGSFISSTVILVTAFVLGDNLRRRRLAADAIQERLERAERERDLLAQQRVSDERTRIARELHDVVAHSVTAMVIQAAAAKRSMERSPEQAAVALDHIESTGRQAMNELRGVLGVLRRGDEQTAEPERDPLGGLGHLDDLLASSSDLPISLDLRGLDTSTELDAGIDLTAFRLVQEALTNVRRHAGVVTSVQVTIEQSSDVLSISVIDDGDGGVRDDADAGYGLIGMRERVAAVGGTLQSGRWSTRGWRLAAELPLTPAARNRLVAQVGAS